MDDGMDIQEVFKAFIYDESFDEPEEVKITRPTI